MHTLLSAQAKNRITSFGLIPHPEGGYYREIIRSTRQVKPILNSEIEKANRAIRCAVTSIHFLLPQDCVSRWHRVQAEEIWIWLEGAPLLLHDSNLLSYEIHQLDSENRQTLISSGNWQAAKSLGEYSLMACIVAPGFEFSDFELIDPKQIAANTLKRLHSEAAQFI